MHQPIYFHELDLFQYEPISPIWMIIYILSSYCFFTILNRRIVSIKMDKSTWKKRNTLLSFIHAAICSVLLVIGILRAPEIFQDPLSHSNRFNYALIALSIGYFLYDSVDCLQNATLLINGFLFHHVIVIVFFIHVLFYTRNVGYAIYGLSLEVNSFFLHARRLFRWFSPILTSIDNNNRLKLLIDAGNYITFILFRFGTVVIGLRALCIQGHRMNSIAHIFTAVISLCIGILNIVLFYRLIKSQLIGKSKNQKRIADGGWDFNRA